VIDHVLLTPEQADDLQRAMAGSAVHDYFPHDFTVDTSSVTPEAAARSVLEFISGPPT